MANQIRQDIITMLVEAGSGHSAGPLGMADVFTALYFSGAFNVDPKNPSWPDRDRLVLSNGHICPALYAVMARAGFFSVEELKTLRKLGTRLQGHPHRRTLPGLETTSGPLGCGLGQAIGMALAAKLDNKKYRVYCLMSDGEQQEGNVWESAMFAAKNHLGNLTAFIDRNYIQIDGSTEDVMPIEPLADKYKAFGWHVLEIDGHNLEQIISAVNEAGAIYEKPVLIIAHTIPGKGISFMEKDYRWHGKPPNQEQAEEALRQLRALGSKITGEHE